MAAARSGLRRPPYDAFLDRLDDGRVELVAGDHVGVSVLGRRTTTTPSSPPVGEGGLERGPPVVPLHAGIVAADLDHLPAEAGGHRRRIGPLGGAEQALEGARGPANRPGAGRRRSPPRVVGHHHGAAGPPVAGPHQRRHVVEEGQVADQRHRRAGRRPGPPRGRSTPPRRCRWPPGWPAPGGVGRGAPKASTSRTGIDDDTTSVAPSGDRASTGRRAGSPSSATGLRPPSSPVVDDLPGRRLGLLPAGRSHAAPRRAPTAGCPPPDRGRRRPGQKAVGSARTTVVAARSGSPHRHHGSTATVSAPAAAARPGSRSPPSTPTARRAAAPPRAGGRRRTAGTGGSPSAAATTAGPAPPGAPSGDRPAPASPAASARAQHRRRGRRSRLRPRSAPRPAGERAGLGEPVRPPRPGAAGPARPGATGAPSGRPPGTARARRRRAAARGTAG